MGIAFRGGGVRAGASWSYSGFGSMRKDLAGLVGIVLDEMDGFGGAKKWNSVSPDPIHILLDHSDCEGEISAEDCAIVAPRLAELAPKLSDLYDAMMAERLANFMLWCAANGAALEFC